MSTELATVDDPNLPPHDVPNDSRLVRQGIGSMTPAQARVDSVSRTMGAAMWNLEEAVQFVCELEAAIAPIGYHAGLIGGVLLKGRSDKDLDIVLYPHSKGRTPTVTADDAWAFLIQRYKPDEQNKCDSASQLRDEKDVRWISAHGKRIDFFFLS